MTFKFHPGLKVSLSLLSDSDFHFSSAISNLALDWTFSPGWNSLCNHNKISARAEIRRAIGFLVRFVVFGQMWCMFCFWLYDSHYSLFVSSVNTGAWRKELTSPTTWPSTTLNGYAATMIFSCGSEICELQKLKPIMASQTGLATKNELETLEQSVVSKCLI